MHACMIDGCAKMWISDGLKIRGADLIFRTEYGKARDLSPQATRLCCGA